MATAAVSRPLWLLHLRARNVSPTSTSYQSTPGSLITGVVAASNLEFRCCRRSSRHLDVAAFRSRFLPPSFPSTLPSHCLSVRSISSTRVLRSIVLPHFLLVATSLRKRKRQRKKRDYRLYLSLSFTSHSRVRTRTLTHSHLPHTCRRVEGGERKVERRSTRSGR